ncbi:NUDIX domain-containing protein [Candidatus Woesearchaeota archaeon]|jgi:8-oxo-dGTP pyrophosphatase MutT (NUDIX family)|nr:NUDIX domain-containing protein [Candidatus Woesearchaeota archaeon]MBT4322299.1 NUDIX domain-containing protein [Candidatus Woesearchaeota archaeon]MBT4630802.1 NUDIX domain-containing protein [Candidatus Woesearchaeota archaeon]
MEVIKEFLSTVFVVDKNKILMTWNKKVRSWIPVGGHIEPNELPCDSVIREAKEESGLDIELVSPWDKSKSGNLIQPIHVHLDHIKEDHKHINLIYFGIVKGGDLLEESDEQTPLKWFSQEEIEKEELFPNVKEWALEALNKLGNKY